MTPELARRVAKLGLDNRSGASVLAAATVMILRDSHEGMGTVNSVTIGLCLAQPSMAPIWNAAALAPRPDGALALERYGAQLRRAPTELALVAVGLFLTEKSPNNSFSVVTVSASSSVRNCLLALSKRCRLRVLCAESRPLFEGREFAKSLAAAGIETSFCTDAAVSRLSYRANAVLVGADAVGPDWFINKCDTRQVIEVAAANGLAVYVVASRDKFLNEPLVEMLTPSRGKAVEVWSEAPHAVTVVNP